MKDYKEVEAELNAYFEKESLEQVDGIYPTSVVRKDEAVYIYPTMLKNIGESIRPVLVVDSNDNENGLDIKTVKVENGVENDPVSFQAAANDIFRNIGIEL